MMDGKLQNVLLTTVLRTAFIYGSLASGILMLLFVLQDGISLLHDSAGLWATVVAVLFSVAGFRLGKSRKLWGAGEKQMPGNEHLLETILSRRELQVLEELKKLKTNKEICESLFIEMSTLKTHINKIYKKLDVCNRKELLAFIQKQEKAIENNE